MPDLSIIIVNYNVREFLLNLIDSIKKSNVEISKEIIVVDNDSDDGSVEAIAEKHPDVKLVANKENLGFGKANNIGLEMATGEFLLMLNPDTIVREDTFTKMLEFFQDHPEAGIAGCKVLNPDGTLQLACRRSFPGPWTSFTKVTGLSSLFPKSKLFAKYNLTYLDENKTYEVDALSGAFMMMTRETYKVVGGFDPVFFMYGEDLDLCYRIQQSGKKVFYFHDTEIIHYKGESTKRSNIDETKVFYDAMHLFVNKHLSSSFLVESILRLAIGARKILAFSNVYRLIFISVIFDLIFYLTSIVLAENIHASESWPGFPPEVKPLVYILPPLMQVVISSIAGAYKKNAMSILRSTAGLVIGFFFITSLTFFFKQYAFSRAVVLITYAFTVLFFASWRILVKLTFKLGLVSDANRKRTIIVGTNENALKIANKLRGSVHSLFQIFGFIGENRKNIGDKIGDFEVIGSVGNIKKIISEYKIEKVIFPAGDLSFNKIFSIVSSCQGENIEFKVAGSEEEFLVGKSSVTMLEDIPLMNIQYNISYFSNRLIKRLFDVIVALPVVLLLVPWFFIATKIRNKSGSLSRFILATPLIFMGKKSFVGPDENSNNNGLYLGKPGATGLWFLESFDQSPEEINKLNIYYAKNQNIWLDLEILGRTIAKLLFDKE